jgi:hypothetical protein
MTNLRKIAAKDFINILLSLGVTAGIYYLYHFLKAPVTSWFLPVIFLLILIYLELPKKNKK